MFVDPPSASNHYLMKWDADGTPIAHFHHETIDWGLDEQYVLMGEPAIVHHFAGTFKSVIGGKIEHLQWNEHPAIVDRWFRRFCQYHRVPIKLVKQGTEMIPIGNKKLTCAPQSCGNLACSNNRHHKEQCCQQ
jgi:hypothetical protein